MPTVWLTLIYFKDTLLLPKWMMMMILIGNDSNSRTSITLYTIYIILSALFTLTVPSMGQIPLVVIYNPYLLNSSLFIYLFDISTWMSHRHLKTTISKNKLLIFPSKFFSIWKVPPSTHLLKARNLGGIFDTCLSFSS